MLENLANGKGKMWIRNLRRRLSLSARNIIKFYYNKIERRQIIQQLILPNGYKLLNRIIMIRIRIKSICNLKRQKRDYHPNLINQLTISDNLM